MFCTSILLISIWNYLRTSKAFRSFFHIFVPHCIILLYLPLCAFDLFCNILLYLQRKILYKNMSSGLLWFYFFLSQLNYKKVVQTKCFKKSKRSRVFVCTTMYQESVTGMRRLLCSLKKNICLKSAERSQCIYWVSHFSWQWGKWNESKEFWNSAVNAYWWNR